MLYHLSYASPTASSYVEAAKANRNLERPTGADVNFNVSIGNTPDNLPAPLSLKRGAINFHYYTVRARTKGRIASLSSIGFSATA